MNIAHLLCGPVGVRFTRPTRLSPPQADDGGQVESRFAGRHKCRPYKDLKQKFLYYQVEPHLDLDREKRQPAVSYSINKGKIIATDNNYQLID